MDILLKISYAIVACTEDRELNRLLEFLLKHKQDQDEIVIVTDHGNTSKEIEIICEEIVLGEDSVSWYRKALNKDFSSYKNYLNSRCTGDWIFQVDADETPSINLVVNIHNIQLYVVITNILCSKTG